MRAKVQINEVRKYIHYSKIYEYEDSFLLTNAIEGLNLSFKLTNMWVTSPEGFISPFQFNILNQLTEDMLIQTDDDIYVLLGSLESNGVFLITEPSEATHLLLKLSKNDLSKDDCCFYQQLNNITYAVVSLSPKEVYLPALNYYQSRKDAQEKEYENLYKEHKKRLKELKYYRNEAITNIKDELDKLEQEYDLEFLDDAIGKEKYKIAFRYNNSSEYQVLGYIHLTSLYKQELPKAISVIEKLVQQRNSCIEDYKNFFSSLNIKEYTFESDSLYVMIGGTSEEYCNAYSNVEAIKKDILSNLK